MSQCKDVLMVLTQAQSGSVLVLLMIIKYEVILIKMQQDEKLSYQGHGKFATLQTFRAQCISHNNVLTIIKIDYT